jgi:hypothetical protein
MEGLMAEPYGIENKDRKEFQNTCGRKFYSVKKKIVACGTQQKNNSEVQSRKKSANSDNRFPASDGNFSRQIFVTSSLW